MNIKKWTSLLGAASIFMGGMAGIAKPAVVAVGTRPSVTPATTSGNGTTVEPGSSTGIATDNGGVANPTGTTGTTGTAGTTTGTSTTTGTTETTGNTGALGTAPGTGVAAPAAGTTVFNPRTIAPPAPPSSSPTIVSTLNGVGGHVYFVGQNGLLYYRNAAGALVEFGQMTPVTAGTLSTQPLLQQQQNLLQTQPVGQLQTSTQPPPQVTQEQQGVSQTQSVQQQQQKLLQTQQPQTLAPPTGSIPAAPVGTSVPPVTQTPLVQSHGVPTTPNNNSPFTIENAGAKSPSSANTAVTIPNPGTGPITVTSTVLSTDGKTFYVGANGFLYYRGPDGALHVFGSGAPE